MRNAHVAANLQRFLLTEECVKIVGVVFGIGVVDGYSLVFRVERVNVVARSIGPEHEVVFLACGQLQGDGGLQTCHCGCALELSLSAVGFFADCKSCRSAFFIDGIVQLGGFCAVGKCTGAHVARQLGCDRHSAFSAGFQIRCLIIGAGCCHQHQCRHSNG